ncbi:sensor histidine kinase [Mesohalobacter halotolerans]|uniref:histidine kinase n=1 Tax=Mesohalobacter halotolerans TaxID=1883405 RepID=A0A4U5TNJ2_9FLAO|nr:HAMP domain-containing sensor histidine kinase [Mesohalobacter halotolerans]MBS3738174.1 HAMP domain-containing histidine kinase [Psychroflexus sp.]TKS55557.1 HAMP domain-containing histidine kinase [Mesohalobacter halotolerans]
MKISIKNRIALYSVLGIATLSLGVFIAIYFSVKNHSYSQIDKKLEFEAEKHIHEVITEPDTVYFVYKDEWLEREHIEIEVYPLFVELVDKKGQSLDKSPNLLNRHLDFDLSRKDTFIQNDKLNNNSIRQIQIPLQHSGQIAGYIGIAASFGDTELVLDALLDMLLIIYPILLFVTFFTSKLISNITIKPISKIANRVSEIHTGNLDKRIKVVENGDELQTLSVAINDFLDRIDEGLKREKQFTADASHQLRTPLSVIKGNLEILLRKPRNEQEYKREAKKAISKIDEMTNAVEKLLILARLNKSNIHLNFENINMYLLLEQIFIDYKRHILSKELVINIDKKLKNKTVYLKKSFLSLIFDNLISNAVKYADNKSKISVFSKDTENGFYLIIQNSGPEISREDLEEIFIPFYRNKNHEISEKGYGLGLAIVKKAAEALDISIRVTSEKGITSFSLFFET